MKILILGSSGQIGTFLCKHLRDAGHEVRECDLVRGYEDDLRMQWFSTRHREMVRNSDFVFFLAFDVGGSRYLAKYQHTFEFIDNNIRIMENVFSYLHAMRTPFLFASSQMSNMSDSPYGVAKAVGEAYTKALGGLVAKFWNVYGIEHDFEKAHVITDFILKAKNTGIIDMMTDGKEVRDFLYAQDCCEALEILMNKYDVMPRNEELCVTSFVETRILDVAVMIARQIEASIVPAKGQTDVVQKDKRNQPSRYILEHWQPKTSLEDGIAKVIEGMK